MKSTPLPSTALPQMAQPSINPSRLIALVVILGVISLVLIHGLAQRQARQEMLYWQNTMSIMADDRVAGVEGWLEHHFTDLSAVANNPSLQLYVTELETPKPAAAPLTIPTPASPSSPPDDPAQAVYLRNMLLLTADRLGFLENKPDPLKAIHANVHPPSGTGLAILDNNGKILVSTQGLPVIGEALAAKIAAAPRGAPHLIDIFAGEGGTSQIGFVLPVYPIQGDPVAAQQIGRLVGIKNVGADFFKLLQQPGVTESTLEALLLRKQGDNVEYLSPGADSKSVAPHMALNTPSLDAAAAVGRPGDFGLLQDRAGRSVLATSRAVKGAPWVLLLHIDRNQALAESDAWLASMQWIMLLVLATFVLSIIAAWWYGTSKRAMLLSAQTGRLAAHSLAQEKLLRLVTDNQPEPIFIADSGNVVRFANERLAQMLKVPAGDVVGKELPALMGPSAAEGYTEGNKAALDGEKTVLRTHRMEGEGGLRILRSEHIPLKHIPIDGLAFPSPGVLVVDQDVTEIVAERERRVRTLHQLIGTLVRMVDARDPNAADHSARVALVAREVATGLGLEPLLVETAETAGNLMNIGKIVIPSELLTRTAALGKEDVQTIRDSLNQTVALLSGIDFDGPVVDTLTQAAEHIDGSGPLGLKGEAILITARIVAVANAFIGMISPRAWRAAIGTEQAAKLLLEKIDTQFDRRVVIALINFIENQQGREALANIAKQKLD